MSPLLLAALFDGSLVTMLSHPSKLIALAYVVPLVVLFVWTKWLGWPVPFVNWPMSGLQWLATPAPKPIGQMTVPQLVETLVKAGFTMTKPPTQPPAAS